MKKESIMNILSCIDNDMRNTYKEILSGQPYKLYMKETLEAKYDLLKYAIDNGLMDFDLDYIKENDKYIYEEIYK